MADAANIDVDEIGLSVVADSSALHREGGVAYLRRRYARDTDVDGLGFHVLTVEGNSMTVFAKVVVAPGRSISADDIDHAVGMAEACQQLMKQVELSDVVIFDVACAVIAEKVIELRDSFRDVTIADAVNNVDAFAGVEVIKVQAINGSRRRRVGGRSAQAGCGREGKCESENRFPEQHDAIQPTLILTTNKYIAAQRCPLRISASKSHLVDALMLRYPHEDYDYA